MISAADIVGHPRGIAAGVRAVRESGLRVTGLEALRDFEGLDGPACTRTRSTSRSRCSTICGAIGGRLAARRGVDVDARRRRRRRDRPRPAQARDAGDAAGHPDRVQGRVVEPHGEAISRAAGDIVFRANCPNLGIAIDAFDVLAARTFRWTTLDAHRSRADLPGPALRLHVAGDPLDRGAGDDRDALSRLPGRRRAQRGARRASSPGSTRSATAATTASTSTTTTTCRCRRRPSPAARGAPPTGSGRRCCGARCRCPTWSACAPRHVTRGAWTDPADPDHADESGRRWSTAGSAHSGLEVSPICLGTMMFGDRTDAAEAQRIVDAAFDAGVNFIDTADVYAQGRVREASSAPRSRRTGGAGSSRPRSAT